AVIEGTRLARKYFQDAHRSRPSEDGDNGNRAQSQLAADVRIYAKVLLCIFTAQTAARAQTLSRDSGIAIQLDTQLGTRVATPCPANHALLVTQGHGGTACTRDGLCLSNDLVQESVQVQIARCQLFP